MYDGLTGRYTFPCPSRGEVSVPLSEFRALERLPGASHPAVYRVTFACACGKDHDGLVTHDELDWAPLGASDTAFLNLMTARLEPVAGELLDLAARQIRAGGWPWIFFCYPEERPRPVFPSSFLALAPGEHEVGVAVQCPSCSRTTVNLVSRRHGDVPFYNDRRVAVVEHVFAPARPQMAAALREELFGASQGARTRDLAA
jgi:hypothetical protein